MNIIKLFIVSMAILIAFTGCQSSNGQGGVIIGSSTTTPTDDTNTTIPDTNTTTPTTITILLPVSEVEVNSNSQIVNIDVKAIDEKNNPYTSGNIKIIYPNDVRDGRDVGYFNSDSVAVDSRGVAKFIYNAPSNLDANTSDILFAFYHEEQPTQKKIFTIKIKPNVHQVINKSYNLKTSSANDGNTMELESSKNLSFYVEDDTGVLLNNDDITSINVTVLNQALGYLKDSEGNSTKVSNPLIFRAKNNISLSLYTNKISGILPLKVDAFFKDSNGDDANLSKVFNVAILSGEPSAMSLSYAGSRLDKANSKFLETWILRVTDKYNNLVNTNPLISMGMLAGYVIDDDAKSSVNADGNKDGYVFFNPSHGGTISKTNKNFTAQDNVFDKVDQSNDILVTFGNGYTYNASGKWDINTNSATVLDLVDDYDGNDTSNLGFAVGHNYRQDKCEEGSEWIGSVYPEDGNFTMDSTGTKRITVEYDYYMVGKDVMLWTNFIGKQYDTNQTVRIGEAKKITLRALGLKADVDSHKVYKLAKNQIVRFNIYINETTQWYRNANFGGLIETSDSVRVNSVKFSGVDDCYAYVDVSVSEDENTTGSVSISNLMIMNEF
jgi:hypothetical protein